ncbi:MAG: prepilin-type N-terminal cleavage/methylation domain-containing protein [Phycisphaerae bacterium]
MRRTFGRRRGGFTLVEILAVVVILGILAVVVVPRVLVSSATAKTNACYQNKASINTAVEKWYFEKGTWPLDALTDIAADADYFPEGIPVCPVDNTAYALDAVSGNHRVAGHAH